ncbi:hypothetical protein [Zavarzinella formosa]|uniref:hypothetical protein n=1 Tax=Zavarzinella formosa TaxID=360055 RepID=UPI00031153BC|nr:hypothetical protein [Zavarzinella formosa]
MSENSEQQPDSDKAKPPADSFAGLPVWQPRPEIYEEYECPSCLRPSRYVRPYTLDIIIFLIFFATKYSETYVRCPRCMRRKILVSLLPALLVSTIASPLVLVTWGWTFFRTFSKLPYDDGR